MIIPGSDAFVWKRQFTAVGLPEVPARMDVMSQVTVTVSHEIHSGH